MLEQDKSVSTAAPIIFVFATLIFTLAVGFK